LPSRAPDAVEGLLDVAQHEYCRDHQEGDAEAGKVASPGARKSADVLLEAGGGLRYQVLEYQLLDLLPP
jgi:hypothetical protein